MNTLALTKVLPRQGIAAAALQIKTILVPLDFSNASLHALKYTIALAEEFKATIHLLHVEAADEFVAVAGAGGMIMSCADAIALMQDRLGQIQEHHDVGFWPDNCHIRVGKPSDEIVRLARELQIDLVVLPTRGHSGLKRVLLGSTAERVVRYASCPVLIPRGGKFDAITWNGKTPEIFRPRRILVPVDFSECSFEGLKYAALLANRFDAKLRLLHAINPYLQVSEFDHAASRFMPLLENAQLHARKEMRRMRHLDFMRGIRCESEVCIGSAIDAICNASAKSDLDLIVTSTHGHTGFSHAMIGSTAEHVVRYAACPVLVVPNRPILL